MAKADVIRHKHFWGHEEISCADTNATMSDLVVFLDRDGVINTLPKYNTGALCTYVHVCLDRDLVVFLDRDGVIKTLPKYDPHRYPCTTYMHRYAYIATVSYFSDREHVYIYAYMYTCICSHPTKQTHCLSRSCTHEACGWCGPCHRTVAGM